MEGNRHIARKNSSSYASQERTQRINEEKYSSIRQEYVATTAEIKVELDGMVGCNSLLHLLPFPKSAYINCSSTAAQDASFRLLEHRPDPLPTAGADDEWEDIREDAEDGKLLTVRAAPNGHLKEKH